MQEIHAADGMIAMRTSPPRIAIAHRPQVNRALFPLGSTAEEVNA